MIPLSVLIGLKISIEGFRYLSREGFINLSRGFIIPLQESRGFIIPLECVLFRIIEYSQTYWIFRILNVLKHIKLQKCVPRLEFVICAKMETFRKWKGYLLKMEGVFVENGRGICWKWTTASSLKFSKEIKSVFC